MTTDHFKTYGWQSQEQLKFINETPQVLSLLYDLSILPEEISARVRGIVEDAQKELLELAQRAYENLEDDIENKPMRHSCGKLIAQLKAYPGIKVVDSEIKRPTE